VNEAIVSARMPTVAAKTPAAPSALAQAGVAQAGAAQAAGMTGWHPIGFAAAYFAACLLLFGMRIADANNLLLIFSGHMDQLPPDAQYLVFNASVVLAGQALHITSKTGLLLFYGTITAVAMAVVYFALIRGTRRAQFEWVFMLVCGMAVFDLLFWFGKTDPILIALTAVLFARRESRGVALIVPLAMIMTHREQALFILAFHGVMMWIDQVPRRTLIPTLAAIAISTIAGLALFAAYVSLAGLGGYVGRIDFAWQEGVRSVMPWVAASHHPVLALFSIFGVFWVFVGLRLQHERNWALVLPIVLTLGVCIYTGDYTRVASLLLLPVVFSTCRYVIAHELFPPGRFAVTALLLASLVKFNLLFGDVVSSAWPERIERLLLGTS
jgi:hypothetical protein